MKSERFTVKKLKRILPVCAVIAALGLVSCSAPSMSSSGDAELAASEVLPTADQSPAEYSVSFVSCGSVLESHTLAEWSPLECPEVEAPAGMRFMHWENSRGERANPELTPVREDMVYTAVFAPLLDRHVPYLFADASGLLRPDAILDNTELLSALNALAGDEAKAAFPELSQAGGAVTGAQLRQTLEHFYGREQLDAVLVSCTDNAYISRSQFVGIMNRLLGRDSHEPVTVSSEQSLFPDVQPDRSCYAELMEAAVPHGHGEGGQEWSSLSMNSIYSEGFVLVDGWLYCADSRGYFIYDTLAGSLTFGYDGRYTSGDLTLDGYVRGIIGDLVSAHPGAERSELLRAAYDYCRDSFTYLRKNTYEAGSVGWLIPEATIIFETMQGDCYGYAAAFWALARGLGYEADAFSGAIGKDMQPHAWVEISMDGTAYIFDCFTEAEMISGGETPRDMFMLHPDIALNWNYYKG